MSMTQIKSRVMALFGWASDNAGTLERDVGRLISKQIVYEWPHAVKVAAVANPATRMQAQTASLSMSQPIGRRPIFAADAPCRVKEILWTHQVSATISASYTTSWTLLVEKRGRGTGTLSGTTTYSITKFVGGLTSSSATGQPTGVTFSVSKNIQNKTFGVNKLLLARDSTKLAMKRGDVLLARVIKGNSGTGNGAIFFGGTMRILVEDE